MVRAWTGATRFVPTVGMLEKSGTCTLYDFVTYLLMSRHLKGAKLLPVDCFSTSSPTLQALPASPKEDNKTYNLRSSTRQQTLESQERVEIAQREKAKLKTEKFTQAVPESSKEIFATQKALWPIYKVKLKLKMALKITAKSNLRERKLYFQRCMQRVVLY